MSFRRGDEDGYFLLLVAPGVEVTADETIAKDVVLVLDRSGSMEGEKFEQAIQAADFVVGHLNENDWFNIITFSSDLDTFASGLRPAGDASEASRWLDRQAASGATDINRALLEAVEMFGSERPGYVIFLTDGLPTRGEEDPGRIIANVSEAASKDLALFAFGVGFDVDTVLLDTLVDDHHGTASYVVPGERIDETISGFYAKVTTPVLTGVDIDVDGPAISSLQPTEPGDVFAGQQLAIVGRYHGEGSATVRVSGQVNGRPVTFTYRDVHFRKAGGDDFLPRLWATRRVGALLREIRIHGPNQELVEEIVSISTRYGVVTPFTSFLVTEPVPLTTQDVRRLAQSQLQSGAFALERSGEAAVAYSESAAGLIHAPVPSSIAADAAGMVRVTGNRAFTQIGGVWVDTTFDADGAAPLRVAYLSDDYFALAASRPDVAAAIAVGPRVIVVVDGIGYEIVESNAVADVIQLPAGSAEPDPVSPSPVVVVADPQTQDAVPPAPEPDSTLPSADPGETETTAEDASSGDEGAGLLWPLLLSSALMVSIAMWWTRRRGPNRTTMEAGQTMSEREDISV